MATSNPKTIPLPTFTEPEELPPSPLSNPQPANQPEEPTEGPTIHPRPRWWNRPLGGNVPNGNTPTEDSSAGNADPEYAARVIAGVVGMLVTIADTFIKRADRNRRLRKPTKEQVNDFAVPAGAFASRHLPMHKLGPDILDITEAGSAIGAWLLDGPVLERKGPDVVHLGTPEPDDEEWEPDIPNDELIQPPTVTFLN